MSRTPRPDGSLAFGETAAIILLAATGLVVVGAISICANLVNRLRPGASKIGPLSFDPVAPTEPDDDATGPQALPPGT